MMVKRGRKGQAAMEFLMTYGWAILVVLVVIGALVYFMGPNIVQSMIPNKCITGDTALNCKAAKIQNVAGTPQTTTITLRYQNNYDEQITLTKLDITKDGTALLGCSVLTSTTVASGGVADLTVTGCAVLTANQKVKLGVTTTLYKESETSTFAHPAKGEVVATVLPPA